MTMVINVHSANSQRTRKKLTSLNEDFKRNLKSALFPTNKSGCIDGSPNADWERKCLRPEENSLKNEDFRHHFKQQKLEPCSSVVFRCKLEVVEEFHDQIRTQEPNTQIDPQWISLSEETVFVSTSHYPDIARGFDDPATIDFNQEEEETDGIVMVQNPKCNQRDLANSMCGNVFVSSAKPDHTQHNESYEDFLRKLFPQNEHMQIVLSKMPAQSIANLFIFPLLKGKSQDETTSIEPTDIINQVTITTDQSQSYAMIECCFYSFSDRLKNEDDITHIDRSGQIRTLEEQFEFMKTVDQIRNTLPFQETTLLGTNARAESILDDTQSSSQSISHFLIVTLSIALICSIVAILIILPIQPALILIALSAAAGLSYLYTKHPLNFQVPGFKIKTHLPSFIFKSPTKYSNHPESNPSVNRVRRAFGW